MSIWSRLLDLVRRSASEASASPPAPPTGSPPTAGDPMGGVRWLCAADSPFGVDVLDCRSYSQTTMSSTADPAVASSYSNLRRSDGRQHAGRTPDGAVEFACDLRYPTRSPTDGPWFQSEAMEVKWDIYLHESHLYFARSWTGELAYRARIEFGDGTAKVVLVQARKTLAESDSADPVQAVDFLIRSHVLGMRVAHPLPLRVAAKDPRQLTVWSFVHWGRHALFGTFADTTGLQALR